MSSRTKITVNLPDATLEKLRELARANGVTVTEMLRRAIATEAYIAEQTALGGKILVETPGGRTRELVLR